MKFFDWNHLTKAKTNYFSHARAALYYSFLGLLIFILGFIHALLPFMFGFTPYEIAKKITDGTEKYFIKK